MRSFHAARKLSCVLAVAGAALMIPTISNAQTTTEATYVACNRDGDCWRVHKVYAYGQQEPITYYNSDWYVAHQSDEHIHWMSDPNDDRGYYDDERHWHPDPGARAVKGGITGAGVGAAIGCVVTIPIGCAPGAAVGAAVGGGAGAVTGAATTPDH